MLRDLYVFEHLLELGFPEREAEMWREQQLMKVRGHARRPRARRAYLAYILTLFRLV
jgi:hypothetical protein